MPVTRDLGALWNTFADLDMSSARDESVLAPRIALVGSPQQVGRLQSILQQGPRGVDQVVTAATTYHLPLTQSDEAALADYDLRIVLLDDSLPGQDEALAALAAQPAQLLVVLSSAQGQALAYPLLETAGQPSASLRVVVCPLEDAESVRKELITAILKALPGRELALGRAFPGLRPAVADKLIQDTCLVNAGYALGTGVAEMVPGFGIPFAVADMIILTKNQVMMAYRIGLMMGESGSLGEALPKVAGVVGAGFMWRQLARELVAFIPLGVVLKVAMAYAGTFATGQAVYHWYATGEKLTARDLKLLAKEAMTRGQAVATEMAGRVKKEKPLLSLPKPKTRVTQRKSRTKGPQSPVNSAQG